MYLGFLFQGLICASSRGSSVLGKHLPLSYPLSLPTLVINTHQLSTQGWRCLVVFGREVDAEVGK